MIPTDIDRGAPAVVRIERMIAAAPERLWQLQTGVADWPSWQKDIEAATLEGPFAAGNSFTWTTAGLAEPIVSTIYSVDAKRSILWGGPSAGIVGVHRWTFDAVDTGTRVTTEESWAGAPVARALAMRGRCSKHHLIAGWTFSPARPSLHDKASPELVRQE